MPKQPRLIDADKLMQHVLSNWEMERYAETDASEYRAEIWGELYKSLQTDMFDPTPPVQPDTPTTGYEIFHNERVTDMAAKIEKSHQMIERFGVLREATNDDPST